MLRECDSENVIEWTNTPGLWWTWTLCLGFMISHPQYWSLAASCCSASCRLFQCDYFILLCVPHLLSLLHNQFNIHSKISSVLRQISFKSQCMAYFYIGKIFLCNDSRAIKLIQGWWIVIWNADPMSHNIRRSRIHSYVHIQLLRLGACFTMLIW